MLPNRSAALDRRLKEAGLRRIEVMGRSDDRELLRRVARALASGDAPLRAYLLAHAGLDAPSPPDAARAVPIHIQERSSSAMRERAGVKVAGGGDAAGARPGLGTRVAALFAVARSSRTCRSCAAGSCSH